MAGKVSEYISSFKASKTFGRLICYAHLEPERSPKFLIPRHKLSKELLEALNSLGIKRLFSHQAKAIDLVMSGENIVIATPTASGKTLVYNIPIIESILKRPDSTALYLFPLKALAQDQLKGLRNLMDRVFNKDAPRAEIYDGDTSSYRRTKIRDQVPNCLFTNPDMLHLSLLPFHQKWSGFWKNLEYIVIDEVHTYRGIMGSNMGWVFRRLKRITDYYGINPTFILSSATIGNPGHLSRELTGLDFHVIDESGGPQGKRHLILVDPQGQGSAQVAVQLILAALKRKLRTICYTQSRKLTELIGLWVKQRAGDMAEKICSYRAGFLPQERRQIEESLSSGELLTVISTSALELGIDIGLLDLCILVGYPGTLMSLRQRSGRVGRSARESAVILVSGEDALDKYFMENPKELIERPSEKAVINIHNKSVVEKHLICAASEIPIHKKEALLREKDIRVHLKRLIDKGRLFETEDRERFVTMRRYPHREVDLRGTGKGFQIIDKEDGRTIGTVDGYRAFRETHPGAIYLHMGKTYRVLDLDIETRQVLVKEVNVDYFTRIRAEKSTEIIEIRKRGRLYGTECFWGRLLITDQVIGYDIRHIRGQRLINRVDLDLPPQRFETEGMWFLIPYEIKKKVESRYLHFMGGIHAIEHAIIGIMPLLVLCDRNDLGGISTTFHHQTQAPSIFIYDGVPGGVGLTGQAFSQGKELLALTYNTIKGCKCENGCPSCVHSPKCGSGNRPIDKSCAIFVLKMLKSPEIRIKRAKTFEIEDRSEKSFSDKREFPLGEFLKNVRFGVLDLETQLSAREVGGWQWAERMRVSCAVLYDSKTKSYVTFLEDQLPFLFNLLNKIDLVIGFNIKRFDYRVLSAYSDMDFWSLPTLDILEDVNKRLGYRLSLDSLSSCTLGSQKSANGLLALKWWKEGKIRKIIDYCKMDVKLTRDLFLFGLNRGFLLFKNKEKQLVRLPLRWKEKLGEIF